MLSPVGPTQLERDSRPGEALLGSGLTCLADPDMLFGAGRKAVAQMLKP